MKDGGAGPGRKALAEVLRRHPEVAESLLYAAHRHTRNAHDAEDLLQETIRMGLARPDPPKLDDLSAVRRFFGSIMNSLGATRRRAARRHTTTPYDDEDPPDAAGAVIPNPERSLIEREEEAERAEVKAALRALLVGEDIARQMFDLADAGVRGSAEFARRIGCAVEDVYRAQRRITHHARRLKERVADDARRAS